MTSPNNNRKLCDHIEADPSGESPQTAPVLFVDLDGTLIRTDLLYEGVLVLLKEAPWRLIKAIFKLTDGRAAFKQAVAEAATLDVKQLPYREDVLNFITENRALGRETVLATAASHDLAQRIANHLALFDGILASDGTTNLKGSVKLEAIQRHCRKRGDVEFDYIGDSRADVPIWRAARGVFAVAPSPRLVNEVSALAKPTTIIGTRDSIVRLLFATLRPRQWVKNTLVFIPLVTAHKVANAPMTFAAVLAFACFCLCASAVYVLNDLFDLNADRQHPIKRGRPFASGGLPVILGPPLSIALLISAFAIAAFALPIGFGVALAVYFCATCVYSLYAKRIAMLDVLMLAGLYTIRVLAGGAATGIPVSEWLMGFSMFLFVSLAFAKRYAELERLSRENEKAASGRGYRVSDIGLVESMGTASGYIAVLVLALYVNSEQVKSLYRNPWPVWLICPVLMYWISRVWIKAKRGQLSEDPIVFAMRDRVSALLGIIVVTLLVVASV